MLTHSVDRSSTLLILLDSRLHSLSRISSFSRSFDRSLVAHRTLECQEVVRRVRPQSRGVGTLVDYGYEGEEGFTVGLWDVGVKR